MSSLPPVPDAGASTGARALVIGWDGATWDLADRFMADGDMPVLAGLVAAGVRAPLNSTTPPMTLPSWSSMLTGCNPGRHGIFDFVRRVPGSGRLEFTNSTWRAVPTVHRVLSDRGARVASIAVPTTWPPDDIDGVVVSGFDSPVSTGIDGSFCHPPSLYAELQRRFGGLKFADFQESDIGEGWHAAALACLRREIPRKEAIASWLLGQERWDLFMLLFGESDTVCHHFWMFHDERSPRFRGDAPRDLREAIRTIYRELDATLGRLLEVAQPDVLCICSDHGFGGAGVHVLHLNRFLEAHGWLRYQRQVRVEGLRSGSGLLDRARASAVQRIPAALQGRVFRAVPKRLLGRIEGRSRYGDIDLSATRALSDEMNYAATLHLEVPEGERAAATRELAALLATWEVDGHRPVTAVHRREDLYEGPCVDRSPDLVVDLALRDGYSYTLLPSLRAAPGCTWRVLAPHEHAGGKGLGMNGSHRQHGLLLLQGRGVRQAVQVQAGMPDIAPTLLALLGEAVPEHMDGAVLIDALERPRDDARVAWDGPTPAARPTGDAESDAIRRRLEGLGYL
ncbi:MAG: alkaline phosphatase family protein [Alphaproteobacteria bacterium]|nr:alkaline phosphatase family protein [Alphaproteobacteria bacterium]